MDLFGALPVTTVGEILEKNALGATLNGGEREVLARHIETRLGEREGRSGVAAEVVRRSLEARLVELRGGPIVRRFV